MYNMVIKVRRIRNAILLAEDVIYRKMSIKQLAKKYNTSVSRIKTVFTHDLKRIDKDLYKRVCSVLRNSRGKFCGKYIEKR